MASPPSGKRKRFEEMKENVVDEIYNLVIGSSEFVTEFETATEEFISIFKNMEKRQSDLITEAVVINNRYGRIVDLVEEKTKPRIGQTSTAFQSLPKSYSISTQRFLDDTESSLEKDTVITNKALETMITKFNESVEVWRKKFEDLKDQVKLVASNKVQLKIKVNQFRSVLYGYGPDNEFSDSENST